MKQRQLIPIGQLSVWIFCYHDITITRAERLIGGEKNLYGDLGYFVYQIVITAIYLFQSEAQHCSFARKRL